jgi:hypothetical protein
MFQVNNESEGPSVFKTVTTVISKIVNIYVSFCSCLNLEDSFLMTAGFNRNISVFWWKLLTYVRKYKKNFKHQRMHKEIFFNYNTLLHVSTLLGRLQGETFRCPYTRSHYTFKRECAVDCAAQSTALPGTETGYPFYKKLGGPQGRSGVVWKILFPPAFAIPVASRYTDCAVADRSNVPYASTNRRLVCSQNCFGLLSRLCQGNVSKTYFKCLHGQHITVSRATCLRATVWLGLF